MIIVVDQRDQPNLVTQRHKNPSPVVSSRACLYSDQAWRQCLEESNDIVAAQLAAAHRRAGTIDPVNLKYMLGDIQTNCGNLLHGRLSLM
ncbi:hypothetical protein ABID08_001141 [Rhizobium binae]|uniref:Uncharacterized protein n=1 Tax=Rhizobium binae TaxID=1138190 RepID=A0ABV2MBF8_9HYPH